MTLQIRPLQSDDIPECARILIQNPLWTRYNVTLASATSRLEKGFRDGSSILVATNDGIAVGFIWYISNGAFNRSGYIMLIGVDPDRHHLGIGKELMLEAEKRLFTICSDIFLLVSDFNLSAQIFYHSIGYAQIGAVPNYVVDGITELIFRKTRPAE